jgi:hypothetical protein
LRNRLLLQHLADTGLCRPLHLERCRLWTSLGLATRERIGTLQTASPFTRPPGWPLP